jgi:hypothetical protein
MTEVTAKRKRKKWRKSNRAPCTDLVVVEEMALTVVEN